MDVAGGVGNEANAAVQKKSGGVRVEEFVIERALQSGGFGVTSPREIVEMTSMTSRLGEQ